ncbi:hypothetical protein ACIPZF_11400 [Pseudomonas sp. NPDC089752]|uniref:hypothetical protein n=1 Tax=Pseudomonas sp. NPDC089752 TaxID=3364472 RepID=UPI0037F6FFF5
MKNDSQPKKAESLTVGQETKGHNLVDDGSFPDGSIGDGKSWEAEKYPGERIHLGTGDNIYLGLGGGEKIWQDIVELPVSASGAADVRPYYSISLEYDSEFIGDCSLKVHSIDGYNETELLEHTLQGFGTAEGDALVLYPQRDPKGDPQRDPNWHQVDPLKLPVPKHATHLRISFETTDKDTGFRYLYLKRVVSLLSLPALGSEKKVSGERTSPAVEPSVLKVVVDPAGIGHEQLVVAGTPVKLCHGAHHVLKVKVGEGDTWAGQNASLLWSSTSGVPQDYGLSAEPAFNVNDTDQEDRYKPLPAEAEVCWNLDAAGKGSGISSGDVHLGLGSYWTAEKYAFQAQVGHHYYVLGKVEWDGQVPVIKLGNSCSLEVEVENRFDSDSPLEGIEVPWFLNGQYYQTVPTNAKGKSVLKYTPKAGDQGEDNEVTFTAQCRNGFDQLSKVHTTIPVFAESPWIEELNVKLDGNTIADLTQWPLHLKCGGDHKLRLEPKESKESKKLKNWFLGKKIALSCLSDPDLGIVLDPAPNVPITMIEKGIEWTVTGGGKRGMFTLQAQTVEADSDKVPPLQMKGIQLSADLADELDITVGGEVAPPYIFRRQTPSDILVKVKPDSPLAGIGEPVFLHFVSGGNLVDTDIPATPAYGEPQILPPDDNGISWSLRGGAARGLFDLKIAVRNLDFYVNTCLLLSNKAEDEIEVVIEPESDVPTHHVFRRSVSKVVTVKPRAGSPLNAINSEVSLAFINKGSLEADQVPATPNYGVKNRMPATGATWTLEGTDVSGFFGLSATVYGMSLNVENCVLLSTRAEDELEVKFDGVPVSPPMFFKRDTMRRVSLIPKGGSPLVEISAPVRLEFEKTGAVTSGQVTCRAMELAG